MKCSALLKLAISDRFQRPCCIHSASLAHGIDPIVTTATAPVREPDYDPETDTVSTTETTGGFLTD